MVIYFFLTLKKRESLKKYGGKTDYRESCTRRDVIVINYMVKIAKKFYFFSTVSNPAVLKAYSSLYSGISLSRLREIKPTFGVFETNVLPAVLSLLPTLRNFTSSISHSL